MPVVTVTVLKYRPGGRYRAFANVGRWMMRPFKTEGLRFQKLLGSGQNFGLMPNWSTYVFLGVWDTEQQARDFFQTAAWQFYLEKTEATGTLWLQPFKSQGQWDGQNPFPIEATLSPAQPGQPVAVLTRATIRMRALPDFWRHVPQARQRLKDHQKDLLFSIGVGEKPVVQQATISVWRDAAAVEQFAYRQSGHKEIVRLTRQRKWYTEELFARFTVLSMEGRLFSLADNSTQIPA